MKTIVLCALLCTSILVTGQEPEDNSTAYVPVRFVDITNSSSPTSYLEEFIKYKRVSLHAPVKWRLTSNKVITGALIFLGGSAKGFNEGLQFNYSGFRNIFPNANPYWFYPAFSFKNKYKDGDPAKGAKFPLSTSVLVMFTDQYHLNNFIQRAAITTALVIKIGDGKKPFKHYLMDAIYYTACYQGGFHAVYSTIKARCD